MGLLHAVVVALWAPSALGPQWPPKRVALVIGIGVLTVEVAISLADKVAVVASLAGSLMVMITSVLFPAMVHIILSAKMKKKPKFNLCLWIEYALVLTFGVFMAIAGTKLAIDDLM